MNWKRFNQLQEHTVSEALRASLEAEIPNAHPGLHESCSHLGLLQSVGINVSAPEQELRRLRGMLQLPLSPPTREFLNKLIEALEKHRKECEEYEDIDDYEMQHPILAQPQLFDPTQHCTSIVSDSVLRDEEKTKAVKLTKKSLMLTKSLHNLKHENLVNVREASAQSDRQVAEEKSPMPRRRLSSGEYFTDATYFRHLGAKVPPELYNDPELVNLQKIVVKTHGADLENLQEVKVKTHEADLKNLQMVEVKTHAAELENLREVEVKKTHATDLETLRKAEAKKSRDFYEEYLERIEYEQSVQNEKRKDQSAQNSAGGIRKHDQSIQKSMTKNSGGHVLSKQKYVSSEDFRRMNDSVFPIPKSESNLDRVKADARIYERTREAARVLPTMKQTALQRNYTNTLDNAPTQPPPIPEKSMSRVQGTTLNAAGRASEGKTSGFTKNLLSIQPKSANADKLAKEEKNPVLTKNAVHAQRADTNTFGWSQTEKDSLRKPEMTEMRDNTKEYRRQLAEGNRLAYITGTYQQTGYVTHPPMRRGIGLEAPISQDVHVPTIRKIKSEGYALARNDVSAEQHAVHTPPLQAMRFVQASEQGATSNRPRRRVMFEGDSSAETSSRDRAVPRGAMVSDGSSSRADNSDSGSVSMSQNLPSYVRFPPQVHGGSRQVLMPNNGRVKFAHVSPTYIHPHPLPSQHQNPFATFASVRVGEPRQDLLRYESVGRSVRSHGQVGGQNGRAGNRAAESACDQASWIEGGRGKNCEAWKADEAEDHGNVS